MAVPLQVQLFDAFLGTQEGIHSIILPDLFSSGGSSNVYIDKFGRVAQINGYTKQNQTAFTTNGGNSATMVRGIIPYRKTSGGTTTRKTVLILDDGTNEWEIWVSSDQGATATFLEDEGSTVIGLIPDAAQFSDNLFITTGKTVPRKYDGTTIGASGATQSPTITATESATSGNLTGFFRYKLVSTFSDGSRKAGSVASTGVLCSGKQMTLAWTQDADASVQGYEIYRTTGTGVVYYYLTSIDGRAVVAYTDNTSDTTILENRILEEHGDAPPSVYYCEPHKQRMWWLRTDTNPTRGYWSDAGSPESVYAENFLDFSDSETVGDTITGALGNYEGLLVVFTERALWTVSGTGAIIGDITDWTKTRTNAQIGSVSHRSATRVPAGSKYTDQQGQLQTTAKSAIVYFTPLGDIRLFDGDNDLIISHPVRDTIAGFNYSQRAKIHALHDSANDQIIWFIPTGSSGEPDTAISWNYRYGVWYTWATMPFGASAEIETTDDAALLLVGEANTSKGGYVYKFLDGNSFDGSNIVARWMTKTLYGTNEQGQPALSNTKRWRWLDLLFRINQNVSLTVEWLAGTTPDTGAALGSVVVAPQASLLTTADGSIVTTADGSQIMLAASSAQTKAILHDTAGGYLHDTGIRLRIGTNSTNGTWALEGLAFAYQILPGLGRRFQ
jgi:hypothetical protein